MTLMKLWYVFIVINRTTHHGLDEIVVVIGTVNPKRHEPGCGGGCVEHHRKMGTGGGEREAESRRARKQGTKGLS